MWLPSGHDVRLRPLGIAHSVAPVFAIIATLPALVGAYCVLSALFAMLTTLYPPLSSAHHFLQMFVLLLMVVASHQVYATMQKKVEQWPLRRFYMRCLETAGRVALPLAIPIHFQVTIKYFSDATFQVLLSFLVILMAVLLSKELVGLRNVFHDAVEGVVTKINDPKTTVDDLSNPERILINLLVYRKVSNTIDHIALTLSQGIPVTYLGTRTHKETTWLRHAHDVKTMLGTKPMSDGRSRDVEMARLRSGVWATSPLQDVPVESKHDDSKSGNRDERKENQEAHDSDDEV